MIGAIDGSHILIEAPSDHQEEYNNRKMQHSVILQAVCDANKRFINCFAGFPGSAHDARVLQNSNLYKGIANNVASFFPNTGLHILGDSAYPLNTWLLVPYKVAADPVKIRYNHKHSQTRIVVECAFALLKGRWRRLKLIVAKLEDIPTIIVAACVLHNLCLDHDDHCDDLIDSSDVITFAEDQIVRGSSEGDKEAKAKRNFISASL